jgi:dTDP-4-dehydrorhamnose 3,5-epimerase-like enzyme
MILPTLQIQFVELPNMGDARGYSFTVPPQVLKYVGKAADVHLASTEPKAVRGNHYHMKSLMAIVVLPGSKWSFHWDEGANTLRQYRSFEGDAAVLILVAPGASHAVRNDGEKILWMASISSEAYDAADRVERRVV